MAKKINFTNDDFIDWSKTEENFSEEPKKEKPEKKPVPDRPWNNDVTIALRKAGLYPSKRKENAS